MTATEIHKSEAMMKTALENGWESEIIPTIPADPLNEPIVYKLYAKRNAETLVVTWRGDRQISANYAYGALTLRPARPAGVLRLLTGTPNPKDFTAKQGLNQTESLLNTREVPWGDEASAFEILMACLDKEVTWVRRIDGAVRVESVPESNKTSKNYRVMRDKNQKLVLQWTNRTGFHTVLIESIIKVV